MVCGAVETDREDQNAAINPKVVVEVPSPGTEEYDRGEKLRHYQRVPSLEAVVIVSQTLRHIELWQRSEPWIGSEAWPGQAVTLDAIRCSLTVNAIYDAAGAP